MNNDYARFLCGNASAFVATSFVHPMDVIKISKQLNMKPKYNFSNLSFNDKRLSPVEQH